MTSEEGPKNLPRPVHFSSLRDPLTHIGTDFPSLARYDVTTPLPPASAM